MKNIGKKGLIVLMGVMMLLVFIGCDASQINNDIKKLKSSNVSDFYVEGLQFAVDTMDKTMDKNEDINTDLGFLQKYKKYNLTDEQEEFYFLVKTSVDYSIKFRKAYFDNLYYSSDENISDMDKYSKLSKENYDALQKFFKKKYEK